MKYPNITSASAGSGKTYTITEEIFKQIENGSILPNQVIATTFTIKAAVELKGRIRERLIEGGKTKEANMMNEAVIGTINAVALQLLQKYAFQAGVSPSLQTLDENDQKVIIREFLGMFTDSQFLEIADKLFQGEQGFNRKIPKYIEHIEAIILRLRVNDLNTEDLKSFGEKSVAEFFGLYNGSIQEHKAHRDNVLQILEQGIQHADNQDISASTPKNALLNLKLLKSKLKNDNFAWDDWRKLCATGLSEKMNYVPAGFNQNLKDAVGNLFGNDQFREDYGFYVKKCFEYAYQIIEEYDKYKSERGLLDFADQEAKFYELLIDNEEVRADLQKHFKLVVVDEFQDVSPLQLSIFLQLTNLIKENIWVGDPKQSIFAFRGADPKLMNAVLAQLPEENKKQLKHSYRSRKQLVDFSNAIFSTAFNSMDDKQVVLETADQDITKRSNEEGEILNNAINYWELQGKGTAVKPKYKTIAQQINALIETGDKVFDKETQQYRAVDYRDIAILCRSNNACNSLGSILSKAGIPVGVSGFGLLEEPETILMMALLKLMTYPSDTLAKAEMLLLATFDGDQSAMISDRLLAEDSWKWQAENVYLKGIKTIREKAADFSPSKALETIATDLNLEQLFASWGNLNQRISNTDALIRHAKEYQETCNRLQMASSIPGFLNWMKKLGKADEDAVGVQSGNVVQIMTYHLSKGLEWPIVLLWNLDQPLQDSFFDVNVVGNDEVNLNQPLADRELRLFIKPFGGGYEAFDTIIKESVGKKLAVHNTEEEEKRLYYVAVTRARDYIIFCTYQTLSNIKAKKRKAFEVPKAVNPKILQVNSGDGIDVVQPSNIIWQEKTLQVRIQNFNCTQTERRDEGATEANQSYFEEKGGVETHEKLKLNPSKTEPIENAKILETHQINSRNAIHRNYDESAEFGTMIHDLICAFHSERSKDDNCKMIERYFQNFGFPDVVEVDWLYQAIDNFYKFLHKQYDVIKIHRELPIQAITDEGNYINGIVDMVVELADSIVIIDHKTFVWKEFRETTYAKKALDYSGQLKMYESILSTSFNKKVEASFIYFIFEGIMMEVGAGKKKVQTENFQEPKAEYKQKSHGNSFLKMLIKRDEENK